MSARQGYGLRELAATLSYELERQAVPSSLHFGSFPAPRPQLVYVLLDPLMYSKLEGEHALPGEAALRRTIFLCAESPPKAEDEAHVELLGRAGSVFAVDQRSVVALDRAGIRARLLRPGYSKSLDRFDPLASRPIDVLFLGQRSGRRTELVSRITEVLSSRSCRVVIPEAAPTADEVDSPLADGRWPLLAQSKILINAHYGDESSFEWRHALDALHAGAVVVTEHASGIRPLVPGQHLFVASADSLPYVAESILRDEQRMARVREQAYERLSTWLPYALWVSVLRAAIVELVGQPDASEATLNRSAA